MVVLGAEYLLSAGRRARRAGGAVLSQRRDQLPYEATGRGLAAVRLPPADGWDAVYHKLRRRGFVRLPGAGRGSVGQVEQGAGSRERGRVVEARIVLGGVASCRRRSPRRARRSWAPICRTRA